MTRKVLILSVGGACEPIVTSIKNHQPDQVFFICSDDSSTGNKGSYITVNNTGKVCGREPNKKDSIVQQLNLDENKFKIIKLEQDGEDNLDSIFEIIKNTIDQINNNFPDSEIIMDYTGGTKSMSAGMILASLQSKNIYVSAVTGIRQDLIKVIDKTESVNFVNTNPILIERQLSILNDLIANYDYASGQKIISNILANYKKLKKETVIKLKKYENIVKAFNAWDKFDHDTACEILRIWRKEFIKYIIPLESIRKTRETILNVNSTDNTKYIDFNIVIDLINNAERKSFQNRYDDAVGRIYRAMELFAQLYLLKHYKIKTSNIKLELLPEKIREEYKLMEDDKGKIRIGLMEAYELIYKIGNNPIAEIFKNKKGVILNNLEIRNASLLAHGFKPINEDDYNKVYKSHVGFLKLCLKESQKNNKHILSQFPTTLI